MKPSEALAKDIFEAVTARPLTKWDMPPRQGAVDFRCEGVPTLSLEVKLLTTQDFHGRLAQLSRTEPFISSTLKRRWSVIDDVPTYGHPVSSPDLRGLAAKLEPVFAAMEHRNIFNSRGAYPEVDPQTRAWAGPIPELWHLIGGAIAMGHEPTPHFPPGIEFHGAWGRVCIDDPNKLASLIEDFLAGPSEEAKNLRGKLGVSPDDERHAFLVLTSAVGQAWLFDDWGSERLPEVPIALPEEIDRVWVTRGGPTVWWCDGTGWAGSQWSDVPTQISAP